GTSRWDWHTAEFHLNLQTGELKHGRQESARPRITGGSLESWVINPPGTLVAALRPSAQGGGSDLVVMDPLGGRQLVYPRFVTRAGAILPGMLAWSADGVRVAAIAEAPEGGAGIVVLNVTDGEIARPVNALPVGAGARLLWSGSGRYILAGNLLVDLEQGTYRQLPGDPLKARGAWEPQGQRLLYSQEDWGVLMAVDPATAGTQGLGTGLLAGWTGPGRALLIRWPVSATRYVPIGH
ncbi:MAG TPA: hypothetical protein VD902_21650, partial [Symbiobacteriaceae bacterium]|nr:hypothetical protein [Symbiobacteriaceae bacterium]